MGCDHVPTGMLFRNTQDLLCFFCIARVSQDNFKQHVSAYSKKYYHRLAQYIFETVNKSHIFSIDKNKSRGTFLENSQFLYWVRNHCFIMTKQIKKYKLVLQSDH